MCMWLKRNFYFNTKFDWLHAMSWQNYASAAYTTHHLPFAFTMQQLHAECFGWKLQGIKKMYFRIHEVGKVFLCNSISKWALFELDFRIEMKGISTLLWRKCQKIFKFMYTNWKILKKKPKENAFLSLKLGLRSALITQIQHFVIHYQFIN